MKAQTLSTGPATRVEASLFIPLLVPVLAAWLVVAPLFDRERLITGRQR